MSPFAVPGADQPELVPVYAGPTPADPFGGRAFDIFDVMDQAERAAETKPAPKPATAVEIVNNAAPEPEASNAEPEPVVAATKVQAEHTSEPEAAEPVQPEAEIVNTSAPEPTGEALRAPAEPEAAALPVPANDTTAELVIPEPPPAEPLVKPILIGADGEPPAEPRRGWWRR